jgi:D-glycero-alpha-D-manno-heptose 1-phosphate guanylyltransferase
LLALDRLADRAAPFLLLNGDTYFGVDLTRLTDFHHRKQSDWTFSLFRCTEAGRYMGMDIGQDARIADLRSGAGVPGRLANGGVYFVNAEMPFEAGWRPGDKLSLEDDLLPALHARGRGLYGLECTGAFIDIGIPEDYRRAPGVLAAKSGTPAV